MGIILISLKVITKRKAIPFGPFIALGSLITYFYGYDILNWYIDYILFR